LFDWDSLDVNAEYSIQEEFTSFFACAILDPPDAQTKTIDERNSIGWYMWVIESFFQGEPNLKQSFWFREKDGRMGSVNRLMRWPSFFLS
jgi:hypothetical protein